MTETECLRQLLDKRGVEWEGEEANSILHDGKFIYTYWCKGKYCFTEPIGAKEGTLGALTDFSASGFTPEQAVEATFGAVHRKTHTKEYCNRCEGAVLPKWKKCPWCGEPLEEV